MIALTPRKEKDIKDVIDSWVIFIRDGASLTTPMQLCKKLQEVENYHVFLFDKKGKKDVCVMQTGTETVSWRSTIIYKKEGLKWRGSEMFWEQTTFDILCVAK